MNFWCNLVRFFTRKFITAVLSIALVSLWSNFAHAGIDHDGQFWFPLYNRFSFSEKVKGWAEVNPRFGDDMSEIHQLLLRPALGYQLKPNLSIWQGYAWISNYEPRFSDEHRLYQQLSYRLGFANVNVSSRTRTEERFIRGARGVALRAREFLRANFLLDEQKTWAFVLYDEVFVTLNTIRNGPRAGFDQNRAFVGINRRINAHVSVDIGYQNQIINTRGPRFADIMNHVLLIQWFIDWNK